MRRLLLPFLVVLLFSATDAVAKRRAVTPRAPGSERLIALAAGGQNACVLASDGALYCWGHGAFGSLGNGTFPGIERQPVRVHGGPWQAFSVGGHGACGLIEGKAFCWGTDLDGGLGQGFVSTGCGGTAEYNSGCSNVPLEVVGEHRFTAISAGGNLERVYGPPFTRFTCGLTQTGQAFCWGTDTHAELGDGEQYPSANPFPVPVETDVRFDKLAAGADHTCGIDVDGRVWCWGRDQWGDLGRGRFGFDGAQVAPIVGDLHFVDVDTQRTHSCGVTREGDIYCWGYNGYGQLGTDESLANCGDDPQWPMPCSATPVRVASDRKFLRVTTGALHTCAIAEGGEVFCWGNGFQVGRSSLPSTPCPSAPTLSCAMTPVAAEATERFARIDAGREFTCGLTFGGEVYCWGTNFHVAGGSATPNLVLGRGSLIVRDASSAADETVDLLGPMKRAPGRPSEDEVPFHIPRD